MSVTWPHPPPPPCDRTEGCIYNKRHRGPCMTESEEWGLLDPESWDFYMRLEAGERPYKMDSGRYTDPGGWLDRQEAEREMIEQRQDRMRTNG